MVDEQHGWTLGFDTGCLSCTTNIYVCGTSSVISKGKVSARQKNFQQGKPFPDAQISYNYYYILCNTFFFLFHPPPLLYPQAKKVTGPRPVRLTTCSCGLLATPWRPWLQRPLDALFAVKTFFKSWKGKFCLVAYPYLLLCWYKNEYVWHCFTLLVDRTHFLWFVKRRYILHKKHSSK